jgi:hypothetical protein
MMFFSAMVQIVILVYIYGCCVVLCCAVLCCAVPLQTVERVILSLMTITTGLSLLPYLLYHTTPNGFCQGLDHALLLEEQEQQAASASSSSLLGLGLARIDPRSVGVTGEGLYFPINSSLGLFASIALVLALHSFILVYMGITKAEQLKGMSRRDNYHLYLMEHQFTSPDAPVKALDDIIPQR